MKARLRRSILGQICLSLLVLNPALVYRSHAGCDGFGGSGGSCGTGGDVINYTVTNGLVTITSVSGFNGQELVIPTNGLPVVSIGPSAFVNSGATKVILPDTVAQIGAGAFYNCYGMTNVTMGIGVTQIGESAFRNSGLRQVSIPASVVTIGNMAFADCMSMLAITVDPLNTYFASLNGVLFTKDMTTLVQCPSLKFGSYLVPGSVNNIRDGSFSFSRLTSITIGNAVTNLGNGAFASSDLATVNLGQSLIRIGNAAFQQCYGLSAVTIPDSVTTIGDEAFDRCRNLTNITLSGNATIIGFRAFYGCDNLISVAIPNSVASIGWQAFSSCPSLTAISVDESNLAYSSLDGVLFNKSQTVLIRCPETKPGAYHIPHTVNLIERNALQNCRLLTTLTVPSSVSSVGGYAFAFCASLSGVYFEGDAPTVFSDFLLGAFSGDTATVYYLPGTSGWADFWGGAPTEPWVLPNPVALTVEPYFGMLNNQFGFRVSWATNVPVVVEACTDLGAPVWTPLTTNSLVPDGWFQFSDPGWTSYPSRFYRVRQQ